MFTDIEGSYRQWERHPIAMPAALAAHDAILQRAVESSGGRIFKTIGDAVCAVFDQPLDGARAAIHAQRALHATDWVTIGLTQPLTVRMALQTGEAVERDGDFSGLVLNRISRLLRAGHGGQVLLTRSIATEMEAAPLPGVGLRDLGERRLRDVPGANRIYQLDIDGLPTVFPPLETLDTVAHNLPVALNTCLDREIELAQIRHLLLDSPARLVTLLGPGGIGKTRLALHAATQLIDAFPGGIWFVDLSGIRDASLAPTAVAAVLGARLEPGLDSQRALAAAIGEREMLLLLDNCEQIVDGLARFISGLLPNAPGLRILATSRVPLELRGEQRIDIGPLPIETNHDAGPAVQLFVERAQQIRPAFAMTDANQESVYEICRRVDGIPLALELAAARVAVLSPEALRTRLSSRLSLLTSTSRDLPERHQTLRGAIEWSYALLSSDEQTAFRALSVFQGGWSLAGAQAVTGLDELATMEVLGSLRDKSLVRLAETDDGEPRYSMLETIQEYGYEQLAASGAIDQMNSAHAAYFVGLSAEASAYIEGGPQQAHWLALVEREIANVRAAMQWGIDSGNVERTLDLCVNLWFYWSLRGLAGEGQRWFERSLSLAAEIAPVVRAGALHQLGILCVERGELQSAVTLFEASHAMSTEEQDEVGIALSEIVLGMVAGMQGRSSDEYRLQSSALERSRQLGSQRMVASSLLNLATWARNHGKAELALEYLDQVIALQIELGDDPGVEFSQTYRARILGEMGDVDLAAELLLQSEQVFSLHGIEEGMCLAWLTRSEMELKRGNIVLAQMLIADTIQLCTTRGDKIILAAALETYVSIAVADGEFIAGAEAFGESTYLRARTSSVPAYVDRPQLDTAVAALEMELGRRQFELYRERGKQKQMRAIWTEVASPDFLSIVRVSSSGTPDCKRTSRTKLL